MVPLFGGPCGDTRKGVPVLDPVDQPCTVHHPLLVGEVMGSKLVVKEPVMAGIILGSSASAVVAHPELSINGGVVTATSFQIAQHFNKRHANVMRAIKSLLSELPAADQLNFERITTGVPVAGATNAEGSTRSCPAYRMTRDGFMLLAMGFTGKEALRWKLAYIAAFNRMEAELQKPTHDPARIQLAHSLAAQAAAQVTQTVFEAILSGRDSDWRRARYLLSFGFDRDGQASIPQALVVADDQMVTSITELTGHISKHDIIISDAKLASLATACTQQLTERAQVRERKALAAQAAASSTPQQPGTVQMTFIS